MKNSIIVLLVMFLSFNVTANPIWIPVYFISELLFDEPDNWQLELFCDAEPNTLVEVDSVYLVSCSDTIKIPNEFLLDSVGYCVITADLLGDQFYINPSGDSLSVLTYCDEMCFGESSCLIFGDKEGAEISIPVGYQSLALYSNFWCFVKDDSPNIGAENDTSGMCGTISGYVYDISLFPAKNRTFILDFPFDTDENGHFSLRVLSRPHIYNWIRYYTWQGHMKNSTIDSLGYVMEPDSVIYSDIFLTDTLLSEIKQPISEMSPVNIYPNPINGNQKLNVEIDLPVVSANFYVSIKSIDGKQNMEYKIDAKTNEIEMPRYKGVYIVSVMTGNQIVASKKIVKTNE